MANKFQGKCSCGAQVPSGRGELVKSGGKWSVTCSGCQGDWRIYEDRHMGDICYFVGRAAWQYCASVTVHIGDEYCSKSDALALLIEARGMTIAQADAAKHETPTDGRFLAATSDIADPF